MPNAQWNEGVERLKGLETAMREEFRRYGRSDRYENLRYSWREQYWKLRAMPTEFGKEE